ncbi:MAG TPA: PEP/pyruvate-binding domain-containing protein [Desulfomonilia bacterium]|nr:PEP/pyruvate-binding domain-containing protein [Desulfomonilia bacterium]
MNFIVELRNVADAEPYKVGRKAFRLGVISCRGIRVPKALCVTQDAYETYARSTGLIERISLELGRKELKDIRWEELWDASLRIRGMFLNTAMPSSLVKKIREPIEEMFGDRKVAVRSSATDDDSPVSSFSGLHESYLPVQGIYSILDHIRLVWASLWSDTALLGRKESGLGLGQGTMAVIIQEFMAGRVSGVVFGRHPSHEDQAVIEAMDGHNQMYADGIVEPARWIIDRMTGRVLAQEDAVRSRLMTPGASGLHLEKPSSGMTRDSPLSGEEVQAVYRLALKIEEVFGTPHDVEWTFCGAELYALQSRPTPVMYIRERDDMRNWYGSMSRSFEDLKQLKIWLEGELIPEMIETAASFSRTDLASLTNDELSGEILDRTATYQAWERAYWNYFIPFAHGMRLFGRVYNDTVRPPDPYEFMDLLRPSDLLSIERNKRLEYLAEQVRQSPALADALRCGRDTLDFPCFNNEIKSFIDTFGDLSCNSPASNRWDESVKGFVLKLAFKSNAAGQPSIDSMEDLEEYYLSFFPEQRKPFARELLHLARSSYRLRDDDNIYLGRMRSHLKASLGEARRRLAGRFPQLDDTDIPRALRDPAFNPVQEEQPSEEDMAYRFRLSARQLIGHPAGSGIASGTARVVREGNDLAEFNAGEIVVCDALYPDMTFIMPLASGIIECRGGMLIHGAIIAREYGLPCVTGVAGALAFIKSGDRVTVDGYLGIITISDP